jgi:exodeoxyribonuclease V alpha subunit
MAWDDGEAWVINGAQAENLSLAYSATVHKYQGSQCGVAIVPVYANGVIGRTAVYTAMTRGIDQVVFVGSRDVFKKAVLGVPHSHQRKIGFMLKAY